MVLSVGADMDIPALGPLPENVEVYPSVDQMALLEKADVFLTHCGMNSANEALSYGVPLVCLPQTSEQGGVAERAAELGAGLLLKKPTVQNIRRAVERGLSHIASLGLEDYNNEFFLRYATRLFPFHEVRAEMAFQQDKGPRGKASLKKFLDGLIILVEED